MTNETLDFVTVVYSADLRLLELQARSLDRFVDPAMVGTIHIIVNDPCFRAIRRVFLRDILPEYGRLRDRVQLINYRQMWPAGTRKTGWRSQQALKLLASQVVTTEGFLILDAKNHFIRPVEKADFFTPDGKFKTHMYRVHPNFADHFRRACAYFGYEGEPDLTIALPTSTPFLMKRSIAKALIDEIEARERMPFARYFMESRAFTEFYLYYAYILARYGDVLKFYARRPQPTATLFAGQADDAAASQKRLARLDRQHIYSMGIHRAVLRQANPAILDMVHRAWRQVGLVSDQRELAYFTTFRKPFPKWRRILPF